MVTFNISILNTLPVRAKVKANRSRALPWAEDWLPFQGAPFRALFVYHVRMLRHLLFGSKPRRLFLDYNHPT